MNSFLPLNCYFSSIFAVPGRELSQQPTASNVRHDCHLFADTAPDCRHLVAASLEVSPLITFIHIFGNSNARRKGQLED